MHQSLFILECPNLKFTRTHPRHLKRGCKYVNCCRIIVCLRFLIAEVQKGK